MTAIVNCYPMTPPDYSRRGLKTETYKASWYVEVDETVSAHTVIDLARDTDLANPIPDLGDVFEWTNGDGGTLKNTFTLALDFDAKLLMRNQDDVRAWIVTVTWRAPDPAQDETPDITYDGTPVDRPAVFWIEYSNHEYELSHGKPVSYTYDADFDVTVQSFGAREIMQNSAGDAFPPLRVQSLRPVLCIAKNVSSHLTALSRNNTFDFSTNSDSFEVTSTTDATTLSVAKHYARFLRADTSTEQYSNGVRYYRMITRIELSRTPYYETRMNEGLYVSDELDPNKLKQVFDDDGALIPGPYKLDANGFHATDPTEYSNKLYLALREKDYSTLLS